MKKIVFLLFILCSTLTVNAQFIVSVLQQHQKLIILAILLLNTKMFMVEPSKSRLQKKQTTLVIRKQSKKVTISIQPFGHGNIDKKMTTAVVIFLSLTNLIVKFGFIKSQANHNTQVSHLCEYPNIFL